MRTTQGRYGQGERRRQAVAEVRALLARLYRGFVWWGSLYEDADLAYEQERRREEIIGLLGELSCNYLARSVWLEGGTRKKIERFIDKSEDLYSEFYADIEERGYTRARAGMTKRIRSKLGLLRKEAESDLKDEPDDPSQPRWRRRP